MPTLQKAALDLVEVLTDVIASAATGGSATTLQDTGAAALEPSGWFLGGPLFFKTGGKAGRSAEIAVDADGPPRTLTFVDPGGTAVVAGDKYVAAGNRFPRGVLIESINKALRDLGALDQLSDGVSLIVADQYDYDLSALSPPVSNVLQVHEATLQASPWDYETHHHWREEGKYLRFDHGWLPLVGTKLRIFWRGDYTDVETDTAALPTYVRPAWLKWAAAVYACLWSFEQKGRDDPKLIDLYNLAKGEQRRYTPLFPAAQMQWSPRFGQL